MQFKPWLVLVLAGAFVGTNAVGAADTVGNGPAAPKAETVVLVAKRTLMSAPAAPAVGAGFTSGGELHDEQGRAPVGDGYSHCGVVAVSPAIPPAITAHCTTVYRLKDGQLHLSGMRDYRSIAAGFDDATVAITGGTGVYENARGQGTITRTSTRSAVVSYRATLTVITD